MSASPRQSRSATLTASLQLAGGMAVFGSGTPVSKLVTNEFPEFIGSGLRITIAAAALAPFVLRDRRAVARYRTADWIFIGAIAVVGMFCFSAFMLFGMKLISGVVGSIVMSTTPAVTAVGAFLFLRERIGWRKAAAVALAVLGVLVLHLGGGGASSASSSGASGVGAMWLGSLLIFGAVCSEASYTLLGKAASEHARPVTVAGLAAMLAIPLFVPFAVYQAPDFDIAAVSWRGWAALVWWGAGTLALGSALWYRGVSSVPGSTAAGFMGVMPVSALVLSYVLLGEAFQWMHLIGFTIVFAGVLLIAWQHGRDAPGESASSSPSASRR